MSALDRWLMDRPDTVKRLGREFPLGTVLHTRRPPAMFVLGYTEDDMLIVSITDPFKDYQKAVDTRMWICAAHFRGPKTRRVQVLNGKA